MTSALAIINEIKAAISQSRYPPWHFGLTNDAAERKKYWGTKHRADLSRWQEWVADSISEARTVEGYFSGENMLAGGTGGSLTGQNTVFVYIF